MCCKVTVSCGVPRANLANTFVSPWMKCLTCSQYASSHVLCLDGSCVGEQRAVDVDWSPKTGRKIMHEGQCARCESAKTSSLSETAHFSCEISQRHCCSVFNDLTHRPLPLLNCLRPCCTPFSDKSIANIQQLQRAKHQSTSALPYQSCPANANSRAQLEPCRPPPPAPLTSRTT